MYQNYRFFTDPYNILPATTIRGKGTLESAGVLGKATYGTAVATVRLSPLADASIRPYIGIGASWMIVFNSKDAFVKDLKIKNAIGPVAQIGLDIPINPRWSAVIDVKKVWFDTQAKGSLLAMGDALMRADIDVDPLVTSFSLAYHF
ncbi:MULTISPECIES: OmpW/AlkL family protein [Acinetobacter]|uniref:OmpW/AlkL family protein n=1 Tax=Acinetobacter TaxID=469 RepID=UPI0027E3B9E1|nr:OmpW family outer membrane protein [Acinetobacter ursingii]